MSIEYDGRGFVGWQRQDNGLGVQQTVEDAVAAFAGETVVVHGAGRTDSGVHALAQVAHLDLSRDWPAETVRDAINAHLRNVAVSILAAVPVDDEFHARFSAIERAYQYRIINRRAPLALDRGRAWRVPGKLDTDAMNDATRVLIGTHDFSSFRASRCQARSPVKTLDELSVQRSGDEISVTARARSFLHHQVRNIVGSLALIGNGKWTPAHLKEALQATDRRAGGPTAPPDGLYLTHVGYPAPDTPPS